MDTISKQAVVVALKAMCGKVIWHALGGPVHGPEIGLDIGDHQERRIPLTNRNIPEDVRLYEGEFGLLISCAWRLEIDHEIVCGSESRNDPDGEIAGGIQQIVGRTISSVVVDDSTLDFSLVLNAGSARLAVFCDELDPDSGWDNYHIRLRDHLIVVGQRSVPRSEERDFSGRPPLRAV